MKSFTVFAWAECGGEQVEVRIHNLLAETREKAIVRAINAFYPTLTIYKAEEE